MNLDQLNNSYLRWRNCYYEFKEADDAVLPFLESDITIRRPKSGWLKAARTALCLSTGLVAQRMAVSRSAYVQFEQNEFKGSITLAKLAQAAEALDCELVYAIRPKSRIIFSRVIWNLLVKKALGHPWVQSRPQDKKHMALAAIAKDTLDDPKFRRDHQLSER